MIPEDGFSEDDETLAADLAAFRNARRAPPSAPRDISHNGGGQEEVVQAQLRGIEAEEEGEEDEDEDREGGEEEEDL